jgi:hypothetical protein
LTNTSKVFGSATIISANSARAGRLGHAGSRRRDSRKPAGNACITRAIAANSVGTHVSGSAWARIATSRGNVCR